MSVVEIAFVLAMLIAAMFVIAGARENRRPRRQRPEPPAMITDEWKSRRQ